LKQFTCELEGWGVVFLGSFNPGIFHPLWLEKFKLVSREEAAKAELRIVQPEVSSFRVGLVDVYVRPDKFQLDATDPTAMPLVRDIAIGAFKILDHTPIRMMGINRMMHFKMASVDAWHAVGHTLVPKDIWKDLNLQSPGTLDVFIEGHRPGSPAKAFNVKVEPSKRVTPGVFIMANEHFEGSDKASSQQLVDWLVSEWQPSNQYARELAEGLLTKCLG